MERDTNRYIALPIKNGPKWVPKWSPTGGLRSILKGNAPTEPSQDMVSQMVNPRWPPVVEIEGFTVSRHAEFIFKHIEHWLDTCMPHIEITSA